MMMSDKFSEESVGEEEVYGCLVEKQCSSGSSHSILQACRLQGKNRNLRNKEYWTLVVVLWCHKLNKTDSE